MIQGLRARDRLLVRDGGVLRGVVMHGGTVGWVGDTTMLGVIFLVVDYQSWVQATDLLDIKGVHIEFFQTKQHRKCLQNVRAAAFKS